MTRRSLLLASVLGSLAVASTMRDAQAQTGPLDTAMLVGSWRVTSIYDEFEDGRRRETWGPNPVGIVQFTANGLFSAQLMGSNRPPRPGTVPTDPVGPMVAYYGTYTLEGRVFVTQVQNASWPQWIGASVRRTVAELTPTRLSVVADPIPDPQGGRFRPHLEFERIN